MLLCCLGNFLQEFIIKNTFDSTFMRQFAHVQNLCTS